MRPRIFFQISLALAFCLVSIGCELQYNGAFSGPLSPQNRRAYDAFMRKQREYSLAQRGFNDPRYNARNTPQQMQPPLDNRYSSVRFGGPGSEADLASVTPSQGNVAYEQASLPHTDLNTAPRDRGSVIVGPLGLYGQLPHPTQRRSSPLDSPDNLRQVSFATEGADFDPDVDPTGTLLVYASTQHRATADLYLKRIDGNALQQLTNDPANDVMPAFSPNGKQIAFSSDRSGNWDIYIMDITGGQAVQLTNDQTHDLNPSFSPDGKHLVYCTYGAQSGQWELVVIDIENPATKRFIGYGLFPEWSPVDNRIIFQRARERGTRWFSIWTVELVNGEGVRPTEIAASSNSAAISPTWSPDGKHIAFSTVIDPESEQQVRPVQADIWILNDDGSGRANLTNSQFANIHPSWAKDGSIFFVSNRAKNGVENIWAIHPERAMRVIEPQAKAPQPTAMGAIPKQFQRMNVLAQDPGHRAR